ncbi:MAG: flagellar basal body rod modification protein [Methylibium sp.]|nr:flagellar basal body rod modification protein [Methylibium sp.]
MSTATVTNTSSSAKTSAASEVIGSNGSISSMFTTLLVAQIKNQDPLSPTDPSQMVSQLTQLSQMEALQGLSTQGSTNAGLLSSLQVLTLGSQVGSTVQVQASQLNLDSSAVKTHFTLGSNSGKVQLVLTGSDGRETRVDLGARNIGSHAYTLDPKALGLPAGGYQLRIEDASGQKLAVEVEAEISGVRLTGSGGALLQLGTLGEFDPSAITQFKGRAPTLQS